MAPQQYSKNLLKNPEMSFAIELMEQQRSYDKRVAHYHDHFEILYVYKGERLLIADDQEARLDACHVALLPPYCFHQTLSVNESFHKRILVNFSNDFIAQINHACGYQLLSCFYLPGHVAEITPNSIKQIQALFQKLLYINSQGSTEYTNTENLLNTAQLLQLLSKETKNVHETPNPSIYQAYYGKIMKITKYIEQNHSGEISLSDVADLFKIDKFQLSRAFKEIMGIPFVSYVNNIRINRAQRMLIETNAKITSIAFACGYDSSTHFERVFKRSTGMTPTQFRNENKIG